MKLPVSPFVASVVLFLYAIGPVLSGQGSGLEPNLSVVDAYSVQPDFVDPAPRYQAQTSDFLSREQAYPLGFVQKWVRDPARWEPGPQPWSEPYPDQLSGGGRPTYPAREQVIPYRQDPWGRRPGVPEAPRAGPPDQLGMRGDMPPSAIRGYRFRGDSPAGSTGRGAESRRYGYQFRPLTDQERERLDAKTGWRPREPDRLGVQPRPNDPLRTKEAFGYQSNNWFKRYYGERR